MLPPQTLLQVGEALEDRVVTRQETAQIMTSVFNSVAGAIVSVAMFAIFYKAIGNPGEEAEEEIKSIKDRLRKLNYVIEQYEVSVVSLRSRRIALMKEYGLTITPPEVELRTKYRQLYHVEVNLKKAEEQLDKLHGRRMQHYRRLKQLTGREEE